MGIDLVTSELPRFDKSATIAVAAPRNPAGKGPVSRLRITVASKLRSLSICVVSQLEYFRIGSPYIAKAASIKTPRVSHELNERVGA